MVISLNQVHKSTSFVEMHSLCALLVSSALVVVGSTSAAPPRISLVGKVEVRILDVQQRHTTHSRTRTTIMKNRLVLSQWPCSSYCRAVRRITFTFCKTASWSSLCVKYIRSSRYFLVPLMNTCLVSNPSKLLVSTECNTFFLILLVFIVFSTLYWFLILSHLFLPWACLLMWCAPFASQV